MAGQRPPPGPAMVQSLLSLGLGTGVMPALGARNHKSRDVWKWSLVVALGCAAGSVLAAVLAFALLGSAGQLRRGRRGLALRSTPRCGFPGFPKSVEVYFATVPPKK